MNRWLISRLIVWVVKWMNGWMSERVNEWVFSSVTELMNGRVAQWEIAWGRETVAVQFKPLAPGRRGCNFRSTVVKSIWIYILGTCWKLISVQLPQNPIGDKSTLVQVMAWCCQASMGLTELNCIHTMTFLPSTGEHTEYSSIDPFAFVNMSCYTLCIQQRCNMSD